MTNLCDFYSNDLLACLRRHLWQQCLRQVTPVAFSSRHSWQDLKEVSEHLSGLYLEAHIHSNQRY